MKKAEIAIGGIYSNGKGRVRKIIGIGNYPLYNGQQDCDCVLYEVVNDGSKKNLSRGTRGNQTRISFASWAKKRVEGTP